MLELKDVSISYGMIRVVNNVSITIDEKDFVVLLGSNGAGKSTILQAISGLIKIDSGEILFDGERIDGMEPHKIVEKTRIAHVPEGRKVFAEHTVDENLDLGSYIKESKKSRKESKDWIYSIFPRLYERRNQLGGTMSGGEQQMVAIARGLMLKPRLIALDEPSLGLAPIIVDSVYEKLEEISKEGISILLIEQDVNRALHASSRGYVLENGSIKLQGDSDVLLCDPKVKEAYLGM